MFSRNIHLETLSAIPFHRTVSTYPHFYSFKKGCVISQLVEPQPLEGSWEKVSALINLRDFHVPSFSSLVKITYANCRQSCKLLPVLHLELRGNCTTLASSCCKVALCWGCEVESITSERLQQNFLARLLFKPTWVRNQRSSWKWSWESCSAFYRERRYFANNAGRGYDAFVEREGDRYLKALG